MKKLILVIPLTFLGGCSTIGNIVDRGAEINDEAVNSSKFMLCQGASVGSLMREFDTPEEVQAWRALCKNSTVFAPTLEESN